MIGFGIVGFSFKTKTSRWYVTDSKSMFEFEAV